MNSLFGLIILYVIFSFISSLVGKSKLGSQTPQTQPKRPVQPQPKTSSKKSMPKFEELLSSPQKQPTSPLEHTKSSPTIPDSLLELELPEPEPKPVLVRSVRSQHSARKHSLLSLDPHHGYIQAIIMSEVLGPPVSKRRQRHR